ATRKSDHNLSWWIEYLLYGLGILLALTATSGITFALAWTLSVSRFFITERLDRWQMAMLLGATLLMTIVGLQAGDVGSDDRLYLRSLAEALAGTHLLSVAVLACWMRGGLFPLHLFVDRRLSAEEGSTSRTKFYPDLGLVTV